MQLLRPLINIDQQKIIKQQILHEAVLVIMLLERSDKTLNLICRHPAYKQGIIRDTIDHQNIFQLVLIKHLEKLERSGRLRIRRRRCKIRNGCSRFSKHRLRRCHLVPIRIHHAEIKMRNFLHSINCIL